MQLPAVCSARRNHGKNEMSAKCLLQIICIQSVNGSFCELEMSWQKFLLSTHMFGCWWNRAPTSANEANRLPELNQSRQQLPLCDTSHREKTIPPQLKKEFTRREVPLRGGLSNSPTNVDPCIGGLGFDGANLPTPGQSTGCRNRSIPVDCSHAWVPDVIHTQNAKTW